MNVQVNVGHANMHHSSTGAATTNGNEFVTGYRNDLRMAYVLFEMFNLLGSGFQVAKMYVQVHLL